jgi:GNAT superfamily N-acetyltransferase
MKFNDSTNSHGEGSLMDESGSIRVELVKSWEEEQIAELYKVGGWWKDYMDPARLQDLIRESYLFAVAIDISIGKSVGMGRVISDGIADAYLQDVVVLPEWRKKGVGKMIVSKLLECCRSRRIAWIGLIAQPGTDTFYQSLGFEYLKGHIPMLFTGR